MKKFNILLTNDDGIESPGLRAAVESVMDLGNVTVVAPTSQQTGAGRGLVGDMQSVLTPVEYIVNGVAVTAYHCECSPALAVRHSLRTLLHNATIDLLVSGINYGENLGVNISSSGTIGAALEGASSGIPGIAISKQTEISSHHSYTDQDWSVTMHFLRKFADYMLTHELDADVDVLKIEVPNDATTATQWEFTRLAKTAYYYKDIPNPGAASKIGDGATVIKVDKDRLDPLSDIYSLAIRKNVSVTPLSLDFTSRLSLDELRIKFEKG